MHVVLQETGFFIPNRHDACYMRVTCKLHVLFNACWLEWNVRSIAYRYSFWTSWPQYLPTASPTMLKCFTSCKCSVHVLSHVTSMLSVMLHACNMHGKRPKSLHVTCNMHVQHIQDMHVTWPHVVTSKVHVTCMLHAQLFE